MIYFQRKIINPAGYTSIENNFSAKEFTQNFSCSNIKNYQLNSNNLYLLYLESSEQLNIDKNNLNKIMEENQNILYKINCQ
jgi:hypothetical protein